MVFSKDFIHNRLLAVEQMAEDMDDVEPNEIEYKETANGDKWSITDSTDGTEYLFHIDDTNNVSVGKLSEDSWTIYTSRWGNNSKADFEETLILLHKDPDVVFEEYRTAEESVANEVSV
ncbi:hypothetical protein [Halobacterium noricense]|uniref:hypothetical protein n=1 Tax=Halobacterium noricense TaxID=223182 RepID=UPI001E34D14A|nr:hypothetical protein [Halobacterium noricense]UHH25591.1 hypothetical protein LT974_01290 [Halobacterium noricense]